VWNPTDESLDPLQYVVVYEGPREWRYITLGLSLPDGVRGLPADLRSDVLEGHRTAGNRVPRVGEFEFTIRAPRGPRAVREPEWPIQALGRIVLHLRREGELAPPVPTMVRPRCELPPLDDGFQAWLLTGDERLPVVGTPAGPVALVEAVGLLPDEADACEDWIPGRLAELYRRLRPDAVSNPLRPSLVDGPGGAEIRAGIERDGSGVGCHLVRCLAFDVRGSRYVVYLPRDAPAILRRIVRHRLPHGRGGIVRAPDASCGLVFAPADDARTFHVDAIRGAPSLHFCVSDASARALSERLDGEPTCVAWPEQGDVELVFRADAAFPRPGECLALSARAPTGLCGPRFDRDWNPLGLTAAQRAAGPCPGPFVHGAPIRCVAVSADGASIATGGEDGLVRVWRTSDGTQLAAVAAHVGPVASLDFAPDGRSLLSCSAGDGRICAWHARDGAPAGCVRPADHGDGGPGRRPRLGMPVERPMNFTDGSVRSAAWIGNGRRFLLCRHRRAPEVWMLDLADCEARLPAHTAASAGYVLAPDRRRLAVSDSDAGVAVIDVEARTTVWRVVRDDVVPGAPGGAVLHVTRDGSCVVEARDGFSLGKHLMEQSGEPVDRAAGWMFDFVCVRAYDIESGRERWRRTIPGRAIEVGILDTRRGLVFRSRGSWLLLDPATGEGLETRSDGDAPSQVSVVGPDDTLWEAHGEAVLRRRAV
jgi:hypothetical protein